MEKMHSYIKYLIQEDPIITDEGKQIEILHLDIQDDPEIFEDWAKVAYLNKVAEVLLNLNNSDPENRRLARYDYANMKLTSAIKLKQVEKEIAENQNSMMKWIDDYEYKSRRLETLVQTLSHSLSSDHRDRPSKNELDF